MELLKLIWVVLLYSLQELLKLLHSLHLPFNLVCLGCQSLQSALASFNVFLLLPYSVPLLLSKLQILLSPHLVLLKECTELYQMVLDKDVLLSQLRFSHLESLFLFLELLLLVFECLLDLVHSSSLLQQSGGWTHAVQLQMLRQLDLFVVNHCNV